MANSLLVLPDDELAIDVVDDGREWTVWIGLSGGADRLAGEAHSFVLTTGRTRRIAIARARLRLAELEALLERAL